jgi:hypothetical protein
MSKSKDDFEQLVQAIVTVSVSAQEGREQRLGYICTQSNHLKPIRLAQTEGLEAADGCGVKRTTDLAGGTA